MTSPPTDPSPVIAVYSSFSAFGGVPRMMVNLANEWAKNGYRVHLVLAHGICPYPDLLAPGVTPVVLGGRHAFSNLVPLAAYLRRERPGVLLAVKFRPINMALIANLFAGGRTRIMPRLDVAIEGSLPKSGLKRRARLWPIRHLYPRAAGIIALSRETADEVLKLSEGLRPERVHVIANPVITPEMEHLAREPADHRWLDEPTAPRVPVVVAAGRFTRRKDFATLIRAFARLRRNREVRLIILGDGAEREHCLALGQELGLGDDLDLPGFRQNPYPFISRAALLVLSSKAEGSPNVLTEAMSFGTPVVATDCPFGPRALLRDGALGPLVPVGDDEAMARAMADTLDHPPTAERLKAAVADYRVDISAAHYLEAFGLPATARADRTP